MTSTTLAALSLFLPTAYCMLSYSPGTLSEPSQLKQTWSRHSVQVIVYLSRQTKKWSDKCFLLRLRILSFPFWGARGGGGVGRGELFRPVGCQSQVRSFLSDGQDHSSAICGDIAGDMSTGATFKACEPSRSCLAAHGDQEACTSHLAPRFTDLP